MTTDINILVIIIYVIIIDIYLIIYYIRKDPFHRNNYYFKFYVVAFIIFLYSYC